MVDTAQTTRRTIGRDGADGRYLEITCALRRGDPSGLSDSFSVVASLYCPHGTWSGRAQKSNGREPDACGQLQEEVRKLAPKLEPLLRIHLADPSGIPMHAEANGWYFYGGGASTYERDQIAKGRDYGYSRLLEHSDHERAAKALRIDPSELPEGLDREAFLGFVAGLRDRWQREADSARALLESLEDGDGVEG